MTSCVGLRKIRYKVMEADLEICWFIWNASRSRSESLRKGSRSTRNEQREKDQYCMREAASDVDSGYYEESKHWVEDVSGIRSLDGIVRDLRRNRKSVKRPNTDTFARPEGSLACKDRRGLKNQTERFNIGYKFRS